MSGEELEATKSRLKTEMPKYRKAELIKAGGEELERKKEVEWTGKEDISVDILTGKQNENNSDPLLKIRRGSHHSPFQLKQK